MSRQHLSKNLNQRESTSLKYKYMKQTMKKLMQTMVNHSGDLLEVIQYSMVVVLTSLK